MEVLSGLNDGDVVVLNPGTQELDGKKVAQGSEQRAGRRSRETRTGGKNRARFYRFAVDAARDRRCIVAGLFSICQTPREEEPQIVVPMLDVFVSMPGASSQEVEQRVTIPMERLLQEIPGVEYLYSTSQPGGALVIVRFYVGIKEEDAIVRTYNKMYREF